MLFYILLSILIIGILGIASFFPVSERVLISLFVFFILLFIEGLRKGIGTDYKTYYDFLVSNNGAEFDMEPPYSLMKWVINTLGIPPMAFFLFTTFLTLFFVFKSFYKYSASFELTLILFILVGIYTNSFNVIRQFIAAAIYMCYALKYIREGDFKRYFLVVICAALFHYSALVLVPVYFVVKREYSLTFLSASIFGAIVFNMGFLNVSFISSILFMLPAKYAGYLQFLQHYLSELHEPLLLKFLNNIDKIIIVYVLFYNKKKLIAINPLNLYIINFYFLFTVYTLATRGLAEIQRLGYFFYVFSPLAITLLIWIVDNKNFRACLTIFIVLVYLVYFSVIILKGNIGEVIPYQTVIYD